MAHFAAVKLTQDIIQGCTVALDCVHQVQGLILSFCAYQGQRLSPWAPHLIAATS